jgi:hypothetical protein
MRLPLSWALVGSLVGSMSAGAGQAAALGDDLQVQARTSVSTYSSSDGVQVTSPQASVQADLDSRTQVALRYDVDAVSAASFNYARSKSHSDGLHAVGTCKACHSSVDALSGASMNYREQRQSVDLQAQRRIGEARASVQWYHSGEHDYQSDSLHLGLDRDLADRDATVSLALQHGSDQVGSTIDSGYSGFRMTNKGSLALTQLLTPRAQIRALVDYGQEQGNLADPYAFVFIDSPGNTAIPIAASAPGLRESSDFGVTYKQALAGPGSLEAGWRYYQDDWGIQANTLDFSWSGQWHDWVLEPEYRYYTQTQANFFKNDYKASQQYMTRDLKLAAFSSHWLGLGLRGPIGSLFAAELRYGHYLRTDALDYSHYFANGPVQADTWQFSLSLQ